MQPTKEQEAFYQEVQTGQGNVLMSAKAGSGKTFTLIEGAKRIPRGKSVLACAFNVSIKDELLDRLPQGIADVKTSHGLGYSLLPRTLKLDTRKMSKIYDNLLLNEAAWLRSQEGFSDLLYDLKRFSDMARLNLCTDLKSYHDTAAHYGFRFTDDEIGVVRRSIELADQDEDSIDFVDQIRRPVVRNLSPRFKYANILIDESQDLNKAQQILVSKFLADNGRIFYFGDKNQSIYGFTGADTAAWDSLASKCKVMNLNTCFRCSKSVIDFVNKIEPDIKAWDNAVEGKVIGAGSLDNLQAGDVVLCRNNAPLIDACYDQISKGRKAVVRGQDIGEGLIRFIASFKANSLSELSRRMAKKLEILRDRMAEKFPNDDIESLPAVGKFRDQMNCVTTLVFRIGHINSVDSLTTSIRKIFSDDKNPEILFSTVHRAKGLEWKNVYIIQPQLLTQRRKTLQPWEHQQATNLEYVAYTRAKENLIFVPSKKQK